MHEPETRILPLIIPIIDGVFTYVLYGQGATYPEKYHWFVYVWTVAVYYFCFIGANIVAITYLLDSYPVWAGPLLVIICALEVSSHLVRVMGLLRLSKVMAMMGLLESSVL